MTILNFQRPDKVVLIESNDKLGLFEFRPLEPGYGLTIGNALRRVLLSSLEGYAVTSLKIDGVSHEFSTIKGVLEDVTEIVLNLKKVRLKQQIEDENFEKVKISISNQETLKASDIGKNLSNFQVLNPDLVICNLNKSVNLNFELTIGKGRGYVTAEEHESIDSPIGTVFLDSIFTPVKNVKYHIENYRVDKKTDYEKLVFNIETDGSISPKDALTSAAKILIQHFMLFSDDKMSFEDDATSATNSFDEVTLHMRQLLKSKLVELDLSVRALNCLKTAEVETLGELVSFHKNDLLKFRNFGKKSLVELEELVTSKNLSFGMDITRYNLDKE
ncbi:MAG: DNA-directed RNA polymerase subunit alpha [Flavobacteriales bacterium]|nr:DNA-directed RNA polymerase subunit alpha [Flavobacteriales bacterium]